jgi:3-isopropylmalate dehydrogenase
MAKSSDLRIAVFAGDGIGPEVMEECLALLQRATQAAGSTPLRFEMLEAGAAYFQRTGTALPEEALRRAADCDAILFGAMGLPHIRYPDGREISPQLDLREHFQLYAGVRPIRSIPGLPTPLADPRAATIDLVLVRESTEGLFAHRLAGKVKENAVATDILEITRAGSERVVDFAFQLARQRKANGGGRVTCVDKANVLTSLAFFRKIFDELAAAHADVAADHMYVDAAALNLVRRPWSFDVLVTENMFGDILSDLGAAVLGGIGLAPSADIGAVHALFQPCHGSAPDIMGTGRANPIGMFLSGAMMLEWLADRHGEPDCRRAADRIRAAIDDCCRRGDVRPIELGGPDGSAAVTAKVLAELR